MTPTDSLTFFNSAFAVSHSEHEGPVKSVNLGSARRSMYGRPNTAKRLGDHDENVDRLGMEFSRLYIGRKPG